MRVQVDEAGRHHEVAGVDDVRCGAELVDRDDATVADGDVADRAGAAGAVDHEAAADQEGGHRKSSSALVWVSLSITSAGRWPIRSWTSAWVSGQVESAWG